MYIITEDRFLKCGLEALIEQQNIDLDDNDVILDFDNNFIIITTLPILKEIIASDAPFERFLLHSFFKIKKEITLKELRLRLKYKSWRHRKSGEYALPLTRKERALLTYAINTGSQKDIFSRGELDSKTLSTHKYNMLRKINLQSIATLAQVHLRWKSFPISAYSPVAGRTALVPGQPESPIYGPISCFTSSTQCKKRVS